MDGALHLPGAELVGESAAQDTIGRPGHERMDVFFVGFLFSGVPLRRLRGGLLGLGSV